MGVPGGMDGTADALVASVAALPSEVTSWSATGIGRSTLPVALAALAKGGHLRVGMEDVLTLARGVPVESNRQLVDRAVELGRLAQRTTMSPAEARATLGLGWKRFHPQGWNLALAVGRVFRSHALDADPDAGFAALAEASAAAAMACRPMASASLLAMRTR